MSFLTRPVEDLLQLLLNRVHGGFLQTPLDSDHLEVSLRNGLHTLHDIEVSPKTINAQLKDSPVHITSASIKILQLQLPSFYRILEDSVIVVIQDAEVNLCSAELSGYSVNLKEASREAERSDDNQGVNLLTKFIGNILSNIEISVTRLTVKLRARPDSPDYLCVHFPLIKYKPYKKAATDDKNKRTLTFKKLAVSYVEGDIEGLDAYNTIFCLPKSLVLVINFTRETLSAVLTYDSMHFLISRDQLLAVLGILAQLKPTSLVQQQDQDLKLSEFHEEFKENLQGKLKDRKVRLRLELRSLRFVVGLEPIVPFTKMPSEFEPNQFFPGSHVIILLNEAILEKKDETVLKVVGVSLSSHILVQMPAATASSSMFYSTNSMINSDFLRRTNSTQTWELDRSKQHFCSTYLLNINLRKVDPHEIGQISHKYAVHVEKRLDKLKVTTSDIEVILTEAVLARLVEFNFPKVPKSDGPSNGTPGKIKVFVPKIVATYEQTEGVCSCEGLKCQLFYSCNTIVMKRSADLRLSTSDNCIRMAIDEENEVVLVYNSKLALSLGLQTQPLTNESEVEVCNIHEEYEPDQGLITIPANLVLDERDCSAKNLNQLKEEFENWRPSLSKLHLEAAKVLQLQLDDIKFKLDTDTLTTLQQFRIPKPLPSQSPPSSSESFVVKISFDQICVNLLKSELAPISSSDFQQSVLRTQISVLDDNSAGRRAALDQRLEYFKLILNSVSVQFCKQPDGVFMLKLDLRAAMLVSNLSSSCLFETDKWTSFLKLTFCKTHTQDLDVTLNTSCLHLADIQPFIEYIRQVKFNTTPPTDQSITSTHIRLNNLSLSFIQQIATMTWGVDQLDVWVVLMNKSPSQAISVDLRSCRLELAEGHVEVGASYDRNQGNFTEVMCVESTQVFISLSEHAVEQHRFLQESHILDCELGNCEPIVPHVFLSTSQIFQCPDKWKTLHLNIGSIFVHSCKDTLKLLSDLISLVKIEGSEETEVVRKDSDLSSDDAGDYEVNREGLVIDPCRPDYISNFSMHDCQENQPQTPDVKPHDLNLNPTTRVLHCHPEFPPCFMTSNRSLHTLKAEHGKPTLKLSVVLSYFSFNFYGGNDFKSSAGQKRSQDCIRVKSSNVISAFCKFPMKSLHYNWRLTCSLGELEVRDFIKHSTVDKLLHPVGAGTLMSIVMSSVFTNPLVSSQSELVATVRLLPIKLNIDQHLVKFLLEVADLKPHAPEMMVSIGGPPKVLAKSIPVYPKDPVPSKKAFYLQRLEIDVTEVSVDYIAHSTVMEGMPFTANALSAIPVIETIRIAFPRVVIRAVSDPVEAAQMIKDLYMAHVMSNEVGEILSKLTPLHSFYNFAEATFNLAISPYQVGLFGVSSALIAFVKVGSIESMRLANGVFSSFYGIVQAAGSAAGYSLPSRYRLMKPLIEVQKQLRNK